MNSDSDDELMNKLANGSFGHAFSGEDCASCTKPNAYLPCTSCDAAYYCSDLCKRRHFSTHRTFCISARSQKERQGMSESDDEDESDSDDEFVAPPTSITRQLSNRDPLKATSRIANPAGSPGHAFSALTDKQVKTLLDMSKQPEKFTSNEQIEKLKKQVAQLTEFYVPAATPSNPRKSDTNGVEIEQLQQKLLELEKKTHHIQEMRYSMGDSDRMGMSNSMQRHSMGLPLAPPNIYTPLTIKNDKQFQKYFKLKDLNMPIEQIQQKMKEDGVDAALLDTPDAISPNDLGPLEGAYIPHTVDEDPAFAKYFKLKKLNMPVSQIKLKMEADGVDPGLLDSPKRASPNDVGPYAEMNTRMSMPNFYYGSNMSPHSIDGTRPSWPFSAPYAGTMQPVSAMAYTPLLYKDDEAFSKYFKLLRMGMPVDQIKLKMTADGLDPSILDRGDDVSTNDPGPPPRSSISASSAITIEQLYSVVMQQQQLLQQVSSGKGITNRLSIDAQLHVPSVEDQMAHELAAAESAIDDIFGDEMQQSKSSGGMSLIEQLEKKARKERNRKLVDHRADIVQLIDHLLSSNFQSSADAIQFGKEMSGKLESFGLELGADAVQTWSARLLIKNKDTREWYFSEEERLKAGKAYMRLWSLAFLERDGGQLMAKKEHILNAPSTLQANVKSKVELIDRFTQSLKDAVKLKHKIFNNPMYATELKRLDEQKIPHTMHLWGEEMIDASNVLADSTMQLAEEEFRILLQTKRARKLRAQTASHVAERAVQFVSIVQKVGAKGVDCERLESIRKKLEDLKIEFQSSQQEEEDEDDVL